MRGQRIEVIGVEFEKREGFLDKKCLRRRRYRRKLSSGEEKQLRKIGSGVGFRKAHFVEGPTFASSFQPCWCRCRVKKYS